VLNNEWDNDLARLALTCVASEVSSTDVDKWWLLQQRLLQHAARHKHFITDGNVGIEGIEWVLHKLGNLYADQGKLAEAEAMYTRALQGKEEALGLKHTSTLDTVNNLGNLYKNQGKLAEAEAMYIRALQGYEEALGPQLVTSYLPALNTMFASGDLFSIIGRRDLAKVMYSRALAGYRTVQEPSSKWCRRLEARLQALQDEPRAD
jgi:tetratricopeptide (TPR) repeat protein